MSLEQARDVVRWTYAKAKRETAARVVRWEWGTFVRYSLEPAYFEVHKVRRGDLLAKEPRSLKNGGFAHGFDAEGRLCMTREQTQFKGQEYETFYAPREGGVACRHFGYSPDKKAINSAFFEVDEDRVVRIDTIYSARKTTMAQIFTYDPAGRLTTIERQGPEKQHDYRDLEWDAGGIVRVYWRYLDGRRTLTFERTGAGATLAKQKTKLRAVLVDAVVQALKTTPPEADLYALALWWCGAEYQHRIPSNVAFATTREQAAFLEKGKRAKEFLWSPPEWGNELPIDLDPDILRACNAASQDVWQNDLQEDASAFLMSVAAALGKKKLPVATTKDFVTFAVEVDSAEHAHAQMAQQITPARRAAFKKRGML